MEGSMNINHPKTIIALTLVCSWAIFKFATTPVETPDERQADFEHAVARFAAAQTSGDKQWLCGTVSEVVHQAIRSGQPNETQLIYVQTKNSFCK
jgi:hypothetical protein